VSSHPPRSKPSRTRGPPITGTPRVQPIHGVMGNMPVDMNLSLTRSGEAAVMLDSVLQERQLLPCTAPQVILRQVSNATSVHDQEAVIPNYAQLLTPFAPLMMEMHILKSHSMLTRKASGSLLGSRRVKSTNLLSEANPLPAVT